MIADNLLLTPPEIAAWALGGLALAAALWLLTFYRHRVASVGAAIRRQTALPFNPTPTPAPPAASVIVVAGDHAEALDTLLGKIFSQEFPSEMEVIVVNDGKNDEIKDVVTRFKHREGRQNLMITFTPPGLRNVSHRKLSMTLGVKAAHYPVVVVLAEESRLYSTQWLLRMVEPFSSPEIDVVIGSALPAAKFDSGAGRRYRSFTHGHDATIWLSAALRGKPWRGHRANMAFRRDKFFEAGGFEGYLNLRNGDDDLFVSKIAREGNSATVCAAQAAVRYAFPSSRHEMREDRPARMFTSRTLGRGCARFFGFSSLMAWTLLLSSVCSIALGAYLCDWVILGISAALLIATGAVLSLTWRKTLKALRCRPAALGVFPMMLRRPLTNALHRLRARTNRKDYYTFPAIALLLLCSAALRAEVQPLPFGDMDRWVTRHIKESGIIGGKWKTVYAIGPTQTISGAKVYVNQGGSPWSSSNVYAKVLGVVKTSNAVFPADHAGNGKCARLTTRLEECKVLGLMNIEVLVSGSIFVGQMIEPIANTSAPYSKMDMGIPFTKRPVALVFDYKVIDPGSGIITRATTGHKSTKRGTDSADVFIYLQRRWEDKDGHIHAKRVGTARRRFIGNSDWKKGYRLPIVYGDASKQPGYRSYMQLLNGERAYYAKNSKGKMVPVQEEGWDSADATPTHMILMCSAGSGIAFEGQLGMELWVDNIALEF